MRNISPPNIPPNVNVADQITPPPPPFKLKLEIRVSVRISWENFNANRFFSVFFKSILDIQVSVRISWDLLNILNNFDLQKIVGG